MSTAAEIKIPRLVRKPVGIPKGVDVKLDGQKLTIKGKTGELTLDVHPTVSVEQNDDGLQFAPKSNDARAMSGTMKSLANNMVMGVSEGFTKKLELVGVGYRVQAQGNKLNLSLGFSHPVVYDVPATMKVETPSQTEIVLSGADKQQLGQVAAEIRAWRPPEPYKGKGVKYSDEQIVRKEAKKK